MDATAGEDQTRRRLGRPRAVATSPTKPVAMTHGSTRLGRGLVRYQVTDNDGAHGPDGPGSPPLWAVNVHGFFAGGGMYASESRSLAQVLGWRVLNPHLPAFGGSDPLPAHRVTPQGYARAITAAMDELGIEQAVFLGHSMGGAFAVAVADEFPDRTLGVVYRDGVAMPAWRTGRHSVPGDVLHAITGRGGNLAGMGMAVLWDLPDLIVGRNAARVARQLWPDARHNLRHITSCLPIVRMLFDLDLHDSVRRVAHEHRIPVLATWGVLDRITPAAAASEFATATGTEVVWVAGGHSWMLVDPDAQAAVMTSDPRGIDFVDAVVARRLVRRSLPAPA